MNWLHGVCWLSAHVWHPAVDAHLLGRHAAAVLADLTVRSGSRMGSPHSCAGSAGRLWNAAGQVSSQGSGRWLFAGLDV